MFCFNGLAFTVQVRHKINSIQILGYILICLYFTTGHFHTCTLQRMYPISLLIIGSVFSDCVVFYGDYNYRQCKAPVFISAREQFWRFRPAQKTSCRKGRLIHAIFHPLHGHPGWHYNVTSGDVTWRSLNANVRYIIRCFCLLFVFFCFLASYL